MKEHMISYLVKMTFSIPRKKEKEKLVYQYMTPIGKPH